MLYKDLLCEFKSRGIPSDTPSFYDHENFLAAESQDSEYLNKYSAFVALRPYTDEYLNEARKKITKVVNVLHSQLLGSKRKGACIDISSVLARILELEGVWCACLKGSCTIRFPIHSDEEDVHFYSVHKGQVGTPGHYWVYAPPFKIIDISIKEQEYCGNKRGYLPAIVMVEDAQVSTLEVEDVISPDVVRDLTSVYGVPKKHQIDYVCTSIRQVQSNFPVRVVEVEEGASIKYIPTATHASIEKLQDFGNFSFDGLAPYEFYKNFIRGD